MPLRVGAPVETSIDDDEDGGVPVGSEQLPDTAALASREYGGVAVSVPDQYQTASGPASALARTEQGEQEPVVAQRQGSSSGSDSSPRSNPPQYDDVPLDGAIHDFIYDIPGQVSSLLAYIGVLSGVADDLCRSTSYILVPVAPPVQSSSSEFPLCDSNENKK